MTKHRLLAQACSFLGGSVRASATEAGTTTPYFLDDATLAGPLLPNDANDDVLDDDLTTMFSRMMLRVRASAAFAAIRLTTAGSMRLSILAAT